MFEGSRISFKRLVCQSLGKATAISRQIRIYVIIDG
jgi:hypothetical protein